MVKFVFYLGFNYLNIFLHLITLLYALKHLFRTPVRKKTAPILKNCLCFAFFLAIIVTAISFIDLWDQRYITPTTSTVLSVIQYVGLLLWLKHSMHLHAYCIPLILVTFITFTDTIFSTTLQYFFIAHEAFFLTIPYPYAHLTHLIYSLLGFVINLSLIKLFSYRMWFDQLLKFPKLIYSSGILYLLLELVIFNSNLEDMRKLGTNVKNLYISGVFLLFLLLFMVLVREVDRNYRLSYSKKMLDQQHQYIEHVEALYNDLRKLHHDHKNLLSGMYFQVSEGQIDEVKTYLSEKLLTTDEQLQETIRQQTQLNNVKMLEVKSLLLTKIMLAKELQVTLNVEVILPIVSIGMEMNDFLRVLGITLDNAIEAASKLDTRAVVDVLMLQSTGCVEVVIKNPCFETVNLERIWELGYSTKGQNRGIGLATYQEILNSYSQVLRETKISQDQFVQTIVIPN
ncbi:sensor histidine kinase [Candidatus Enterococcus ferrettii]|uniref:Two-component system, LytTR family, sensor histidine kinase AgrC n=1 Tax=Candidatus Enterococcus ferrettii TaxID=2815324 RepID=A0ABV0EWF2_9ENTE|nr:GHKL domain-containing protein [Enterococcus sp. 665A]MBO1343003.1 GHKL domain-containing protein [Enterococcus sp. 665A]